MNKTNLLKKVLSGFLCTMLIAATAVFTIGCDDKKSGSSTVANEATDSATEFIGEGETSFEFTVTDKEGVETVFTVHTDKTTVGEALVDAKLIEGEQGDYGLYVKTVNGLTLDYETDGYYWSFYVNDEYAMTGVDTTEIKDVETYEFKAEKG